MHTQDSYPDVSLFLSGSRARAPSLRWITMRHSSARLWRRPSVGSVCHPGRRSRCWWVDRRCCALCTIQALDPASSTSAHTPLPMRFGHIFVHFFFKARLFSIFQLLPTYLIIDLGCFEIAMPSFSWIMELDGTRFVVLKEPKNKLEKTP